MAQYDGLNNPARLWGTIHMEWEVSTERTGVRLGLDTEKQKVIMGFAGKASEG